jgi:hypothetical protein
MTTRRNFMKTAPAGAVGATAFAQVDAAKAAGPAGFCLIF